MSSAVGDTYSPTTPSRVLTSFGAHEQEFVAAFAPGGLDVAGLLLMVLRHGHDPAQDPDPAGELQGDSITPWREQSGVLDICGVAPTEDIHCSTVTRQRVFTEG